MRWDPWMAVDERAPEQVRQDRLRALEYEKRELLRRLVGIRQRIREERAIEIQC